MELSWEGIGWEGIVWEGIVREGTHTGGNCLGGKWREGIVPVVIGGRELSGGKNPGVKRHVTIHCPPGV